MNRSRRNNRPFGALDNGPGFGDKVGMNTPIIVPISGEITANKHGIPVCVPDFAGRVQDAFLSVSGRGVDGSNALSLELDLQVGGTSVFGTKPKIEKGSADAYATTAISGEGVTEAVVDDDNNTFAIGQPILANLTLVRTATPTTEIKSPVIVVYLAD